MSLHDDFEKETDLHSDFENEQSVVSQNLLQKVGGNIANTAKSVLPSAETSSDILSSIANTGLDTAKGVAQGITIGAADELSAIPSAAAEYLYNKFNPTNRELASKGFKIDKPGILDLYRKNQQDIQKEYTKASDESPWAFTAGQLAGGMTSGSAIGGALGIGGEAAGNAPKLIDIAKNEGKLKALGELGIRGLKTYKQAAPTIALESALSSKEGGLTSIPEAKQLGEDTVGGLLFGLPAVLGLQAVTELGGPALKAIPNKIGDIVEETPLLRQMKVAYGYGEQGINPKSQKALLDTSPESLTRLDNTRSKALVDEIQAADQRVGQAVGQSLESATASGKLVNVDADTKAALSQVGSLADKYPEIAQNSRAQQIFGKIASTESNLTPTESKDLIDYMDAYIAKFKSATNKTPLEEGILGNLLTTRKSFSNTLKTQVPEYAQAAERFQQFRKLVPETLLAGSRSPDVVSQQFGKATDQELFDKIKPLIQGTTKQGSGTAPVRENFTQAMQGMKDFEAQEAERLASGQIKESALKRPASAIEDQIKKYSDDAVARGSMDALEPHTGLGNLMKQTVTGTGDTGRSIALSSANMAGRISKTIGAGATKNPVAQMSRAIYNAPHETVGALAQKLKSSPGFEKYGNQLEHALSSPDQNRRNQVLFTIMQNPSARAFVDKQADEEQGQ